MRPWTSPAKRGTGTCCHSLHTLGIRCLYWPTCQRKPPATKPCNTTAREGNAALWKNISNFTTNPHYKALGEKREKRSASEEIVLRKLFSLNRKHFVMEKFYLWPMKQSVFCIINYCVWSGTCWMADWKLLLFSWPYLHISLVHPEYSQGFSYFWFDSLMEHPDRSKQRGVWRYFYTCPLLGLIKMEGKGGKQKAKKLPTDEDASLKSWNTTWNFFHL